MDQLTWQALATPAAAVAGTTLMLTIMKAALGMYWTSLWNGVGALVFSVAISLGTAGALGVADPIWAGYLLAGINGVIVAGAVLGVNQRYNSNVKRDVIYKMKVEDEV